MTGKNKWMKWRRELMDSCGQCVGFRAKGLELPEAGEGHVCQPNDACPKHCPGFQIDFDEIARELAPELPVVQEKETEPAQIETKTEPQVQCTKCGRPENDGFLLTVRHKGGNHWICTKCLPGLIHG
ncbi:MAG: hypothetical protein ACOY35_12275 [Bacillota bacterium]|nr:hypothetical protein [Bacillota bacterium]